MTTIIIIVVVALVFFVTICVATFMVWKRESEMRTDSLKAIERNLEKLENKLSEGTGLEEIEQEISEFQEPIKRESIFGSNHNHGRRHRPIDPFSWMRTDDRNLPQEESGFDDQSFDEPPFVESPIVEAEDGIITEPFHSEQEMENLWQDEVLPAEESYVLPVNEPIRTSIESDRAYHENDYDDYKEENISVTSNDENNNEETECRDDRNNDNNTDCSEENAEKDEEQLYAEIDLDFEEIRNLVSEIQLPDISEEPEMKQEEPVIDIETDQFTEVIKAPLTHNVGRSGRKYTAEELETLIKE